mgnify:CR=1 FL=1
MSGFIVVRPSQTKQLGCFESYDLSFKWSHRVKPFPYCKASYHAWMFWGNDDNYMELPENGMVCTCGQKQWVSGEMDSKYKKLIYNHAHIKDIESTVDEIKPDDTLIPGFNDQYTECLSTLQTLEKMIFQEIEMLEKEFLNQDEHTVTRKI